MNNAQVPCPGCKCVFSPRGLSQHLLKTPCNHCHIAHAALQSPLNFPTAHSAHRPHSTQVTTEFFTPQDPHEDSPVQDAYTPTVPSADADENPTGDDSEDADVDAVDADVWEALVQDSELNAAAHPDQTNTSGVQTLDPTLSDMPKPSAPPVTPPMHDGNTNNPQVDLTIVSFPHGSPGAPIPGTLPGHSEYQSHSMQGASPWAPFHSKCDWDIVLWAKTRGPSSTALMELLQYPDI
ncbi:hypothetical protein EI94DRAFT_1813202 [Lactarius quietus]|nr:hypothetical protein EI94DRAFT_1813202 [Lactarius quietus]